MKDVFILPSHYILNRWTIYAKQGFYIEKQGTQQEILSTQAARISRKATSVTLKCSVSKELDDLKKAIDKLDLKAGNSLSKVHEKSSEVPLPLTDCAIDVLAGKLSFNVPGVIKGPENKRGTISLKNRKRKKKKSATKKERYIRTLNYIVVLFYN
jgi:hypothetical protein